MVLCFSIHHKGDGLLTFVSVIHQSNPLITGIQVHTTIDNRMNEQPFANSRLMDTIF